MNERIFILGFILDEVQKAIDNGESDNMDFIIDEVLGKYCILAIKFALIKIFLVGIGNYYNGLNDDNVIKILYLYNRNIEHSKGYIDDILDDIIKNNNLNTAFMSILIKN